ncbi:MAG: hypothetical protein ACD_43C00126G0001, partial [uncultured bacterium]
MRHFLKKYLTAVVLLLVIVGQSAVPQLVYAQVSGPATPTIDLANLTNEGRKELLGTIGEVLKNTALLGVRNMLSAFFGKLAYDSAVWISSTGTGQQGLVYDQPVGEYF